ncbi:LysR family transcriptional regulator [Oceanobacillus sp. CFH 90083]|uniref:LysR family transcriptional regulator n=1 Tax=Oceanobacillus sp. CFH 90083 TaxID=2592336 RepID=UPI00128DEB2D|nr:LysR family transcriptional regulator [Oceanobacillus sp. CFH 90083]
MELLQLKYFLTVARLEHMTRAAEELHIAQPALSRTIQRLEEDLGVPLFDRKPRQIRLNPYGKAFEAKAKAAIHLLEEGRREVEDLSGLKQGRLHLALMNMEQVKEPLQNFLSEYQDINIQIYQFSTEDFKNLKKTQEIDFHLTSLPIQLEGYSEIPLIREKLYLAVPHEHKYADRESIHLNDVSEEPFVGYKENSPLRMMNDELCRQAGFRPKMVCETEEPASIADLVRSGFGIAIVGGCKSGEELNLVKIPIEDPTGERIFRIAWQENRYLSKAAIAFREFIVNHFKEEAAAGIEVRKALMLR